MFVTLATFYVVAFQTVLPAMVVGILAIAAFRADLGFVRTAWTLGGVAAVLGVWSAAMVPLAKAGILMPPASVFAPPYAIMPLIGGALLLWALGRFTATGRQLLEGLSQRYLIAIQGFRVMGAIFLIGWFTGDIPWQFALPAGVGDIWAGLAAFQALRAVNEQRPEANSLVMRANIIGLLDFAVAVVTGLMTTEGFLHVLSPEKSNIINLYPLALFPAFFVPIFIAFHLFSLGALRQQRLPARAP